MSIHMIGIDHSQAMVDVRALFSFTKSHSVAAMEQLLKIEGVLGCVILSTCNRMEVWASTADEWDGSLYKELCKIKEVDADTFEHFFVERADHDAVVHLFYTACGLNSQIVGDDQIVTQVKNALAVARENDCSDSVLEVLFRTAITAAKKVKTQVVFPHGNVSAVASALEGMRVNGEVVAGKLCMVIGNGQMGKVAARAFRDAGARVLVTVRQYRHSHVDVPDHCEAVDYQKREAYLADCDYVVSATSSPHFAISMEIMQGVKLNKPLTMLDLAVPRDIDEDIRELDGVTLYDIDDFKSDLRNEKLETAKKKAEGILMEHIEEFYSWMDSKSVMPQIQYIREEAATDVLLRLKKKIRKLPLEEADRELLMDSIEGAAQKVVNKMLFGLKDSMDQEEFLNCMDGLEQLYEE
ncbi:MAG: glutamyl-tRNA reductase [Lachnospiraceae bacterium]|nr:glutamyl-tRNA reductase [Lachnospiraceae bacterium]